MIGKKYTKHKIFYIWNVLWGVITPGLLIVNKYNKKTNNLLKLQLKVLVVLAFKDLSVIKLGNYTFPNWTHILGEFMTASTLGGFVFWAVWMAINVFFFKKKVNYF